MKQLYLLLLPVVFALAASAQCTEYVLAYDIKSNSLRQIKVDDNVVIATIPLSTGTPPADNALSRDVLVSPDGSTAYVMQKGKKIAVVDLATQAVVNIISLTLEANNAVMSPDGATLYVSNQDDDAVTVVSTVTNSQITTISVGTMPGGLDISPDGSRLYVVNGNSGDLSIISTATNTVTKTINTRAGPVEVHFSPDGTKAYISNGNDESVSIVNTATETLSGTFDVGYSPWGIAVSPDGSRLFVVDLFENNVRKINAANRNILATIDVGWVPTVICLSHDGTKAYVANSEDGSVSVIDVEGEEVIATIPVGDVPVSLTAFRSGNCVLPLNFHSFTAQSLQNRSAMLKWQTSNEVNTGRFVIERSTDGIHFNAIGELPAKSSPGVHDYSFTDMFSQTVISDAAVFYYRIVEVDLDGQKTLSAIRFITLSSAAGGVASIYPNPVRKTNVVHIRGNQLQVVEVMDNTGKICLVQQANNGNLVDINIGSLRPGLYFIHITGENGKKLVRKLIVE